MKLLTQIDINKGLSEPHQVVMVEMTVEEFLSLFVSSVPEKRRVLKGLPGIMSLFLCSKSQASRISNAEWFRPAIIYREGKLMTFDADIAEKLGRERIDTKKAKE